MLRAWRSGISIDLSLRPRLILTVNKEHSLHMLYIQWGLT